MAGSASQNNDNTLRARHLSASDREAQIIERAIECFAQQGFSVSTRELAKHIGVTQPLIYRYFGSKEALAERVHQEVFFSRWNPQWEVGLLDTSRSVEERLIEYLEDYTNAILKNDWVRLFIFAALNDPQFNKRYISLLKEKIFRPILSELRKEHGLDPEPTEMDIELIWAFTPAFSIWGFVVGYTEWMCRKIFMVLSLCVFGISCMAIKRCLRRLTENNQTHPVQAQYQSPVGQGGIPSALAFLVSYNSEES